MARAIDAYTLNNDLVSWYNDTEDEKEKSILRRMMQRVVQAPTITPPNEALTLEQLREMDGEPVWVDTIKRWGIVRVCGYGISVLTKSGEYDVTRMKFYRHPPEGEEYT